MLSQQEVQNLIIEAQYQVANLINNQRVLLTKGGIPTDDSRIQLYQHNIQALLYQTVNRVDYTSTTTLRLYQCLSKLVGIEPAMITIDPNYQAPNYSIIIENNGTSAETYSYTQANLIDAGGGNWYLQFLDPDGNIFPTGTVPVQLSINGVYEYPQLNNTTNPARIYGFADNSPQAIELTVI